MMFRNTTRLLTLLAVVLTAASLLVLASHTPRHPTAQAQDGNTSPATYGIFYEYEVLHQLAGSGEGTLEYVSINDGGRVAFSQHRQEEADTLLTTDGTAEAVEVSASYPLGNFAGLQINNLDEIVAVDNNWLVGTTDFWRVRRFDATTLNDEIIAISTADQAIPVDFNNIFDRPSINNVGQIAFAASGGRDNDSICGANATCLVVPAFSGNNPFREDSLSVSNIPEPRIADTGQVLAWVQPGTGEQEIWLYGVGGGDYELIAGSDDFAELGQRPAVSDDGAIVVFYGDLRADAPLLAGCEVSRTYIYSCPDFGYDPPTSGPGIFASIKQEDGSRRMVRLTGRRTGPPTRSGPAPELGYNDAGEPIRLDPEQLVPDVQLGVTRMDDHSFVASFEGVPTSASRTNPITGEPLLFSNLPGLWTVRVDERCGKDDLPPSFCDAATRFYLVNSPRPVVQLNDRIDGQQVTDFNPLPSHPALADAYELTDSTPPAERGAGDHRLAFVVKTTGGDMVVRASHMDTDRDGLPDHWETHGIDMDRDGAIDLDLPAMGADPLRRDLFLEVDWLAPDAATGRDFSPQPEALTFLANVFANAPRVNPDGSTGITAHIDAGDSCWLNMQPADALNAGVLAVGSCGPDTDTNPLLQGGDLIKAYRGAPGENVPHLDVVHYGSEGSRQEAGEWWRSLDDIKQNNFGTTDKWARELAFHYVVFADRTSDRFGDQLLRPYSRSENYARDLSITGYVVPGNDTVIGLEGRRTLPPQEAGGLLPYPALPEGFLQGQILARELGTQLGLLDGGTQEYASPPPLSERHIPARYIPDYISLMNQAYTFGMVGEVQQARHSIDPGTGVADRTILESDTDMFPADNALASYEVIMLDGAAAGLRGRILENTTNSVQVEFLRNLPQTGDRFAVLVRDFSASARVFDDWGNINLRTTSYFDHVGNAFRKNRRLLHTTTPSLAQIDEPEEPIILTLDDVAALIGPFDAYLPTASFAGPAPGASFGVGSTFDVQVAATDDTGISSVVVSFDHNGDGVLTASETLSATRETSPTFRARLADIGGPTGTRLISATVRDLAGRVDVITRTVSISSEPPTTPTSEPGDPDPSQGTTTLYLPLVSKQGAAQPPQPILTPTATPTLAPSVSPTVTPTPTPTATPTTFVPGTPPDPIGRGFANPVEAVYGLGDITALAFAPDGERALVGGSSGQAALLDPLSGEIIQRYPGHTAAVNAVAFAPDGETIVTGSTDTTVRLWDTASGDMLRRFIGHPGAVYAVAVAPDGSQILSGGTTGSGTRTDYVRLWESETGEEIRTFDGHSGEVRAVVFSPDGTQALTGSRDNLAKLWDVATGEEIRTLSGHGLTVTGVAFSPDGTQALTGGNLTARLWDLSTGGARTIDAHGYSVNAVAFAPDGTTLLTGGTDNANDGSVKQWDTEGNLLHTFNGHTRPVLAVGFSPDGAQALSGGRDGSIRLWDAGVPTVQSIAHPDDTAVQAVAWTPDGTRLLTGDAAGVARLWDTAAGSVAQTFSRHTSDIVAVDLSPDGGYALTAANTDLNARIWDVSSGAAVATLEHPVNSSVFDAVFSAAGDQVFTGTQGGTAYLWDWDSDTLSATRVHTLTHETNNRIEGVAISPDGSQLATAAYQAVTLWDAATGTQVRTFTAARSPNFTAVAFAPDGAWLAASEQSNTVHMWQIDTGVRREFSTLPEGSQVIDSVEFSPDGSRLLADGRLQTFLWDTATSDLVNVLDAHDDAVNEAAFAPDGSQVATASNDGTARIWDALAGSILHATPSGHTDGVQDVAYFSDGSALVSAGFDGTLKLWDTATGTVSQTVRVPTPGGLNNAALAVDVSADGRFIASGSQYNVALWDAQSGLLLRTFATDTNDTIYGVAFAPDGSLLAAGGTARTLYLFDTATGDELRRFDDHSSQINDVAFSPDGSRLLSGSADGTALLWDVNDENVTLGSFTRNGEAINAVAFAPNGEQIAAGDTLGAIVWDIGTGQEVARLDDAAFSVSNVTALAFSPDSRRLLTARTDVAELWDIESSTLLRAFTGHTSSNVGNPAIINTVAFAPDGAQVATGGARGNNTVRLWEAAVRPAIRSFTDPDDTGYTSVVVAPDGQTVATGNCDATVYLWDANTGAQLRSIPGFPGLVGPGGGPCVTHLDISADGTTLLGGTNTTVRLHEISTGDILQVFTPHRNGVFAARFSPDGSQVLTAGGDRDPLGCQEECGSVKLWDAASGGLVATFTHDPHVSAAALSPDGRYLATASGYGSEAWLWDVNNTSTPILALEGSTDIMDSIAFSPDSSRIAAGSRDGTALLWDRATGGFLYSFNHSGYNERVRHVAFATTQPWLVTTAGQTAYVWDGDTGELLFAVSGGVTMEDADFTPDDSALLTGNASGAATLWQTAAE